MPVLIYEGKVKFQTTKKDGSPLVTQKGNAYRILSFKDGEEWRNLPDWKNVAEGVKDGDECRVYYYQKFNDKGDPEKFNDKDVFVLDHVEMLTGETEPQSTPAPKNDYQPSLGAMQTAINCAVPLTVAEVTTGALDPSTVDILTFALAKAERIHACLLAGTFDAENPDPDGLPF